MEQKAFTVRLDVDQAPGLEAVAAADGVSIAEEIRLSVADRIERRRKDRVFRASRATLAPVDAWMV